MVTNFQLFAWAAKVSGSVRPKLEGFAAGWLLVRWFQDSRTSR